MKQSLFLILFLFGMVNLLSSQTDYDQYEENGIEAIEALDFTGAKKVFKSARKASKREKNSIKKAEFNVVLKKIDIYEKINMFLNSAEAAMVNEAFLDANSDVSTAQKHQDKLRSLVHAATSDIDSKYGTRIKELRASIGTLRKSKYRLHLDQGKKELLGNNYSKAANAFSNAAKSMTVGERKQNNLTELQNKAKVGYLIESGKRHLANSKYREALKSFQEASKLDSQSDVKYEIVKAQNGICKILDKDLITIYKFRDTQLKKDQQEAIACKCPTLITNKYKNVRQAKELVKQGDNLKPGEGINKYKKAYALVPVEEIKYKIESRREQIGMAPIGSHAKSSETETFTVELNRIYCTGYSAAVWGEMRLELWETDVRGNEVKKITPMNKKEVSWKRSQEFGYAARLLDRNTMSPDIMETAVYKVPRSMLLKNQVQLSLNGTLRSSNKKTGKELQSKRYTGLAQIRPENIDRKKKEFYLQTTENGQQFIISFTIK